MKWIIFYGDGATVSSNDSSPFDAPGTNVQIIVMDSRYMVRGDDFYVWYDDREIWEGIKFTHGLWDYLFNTTGPKAALLGRTIDGDEFDAIHRQAMKVIHG